MTVLMAVLLLFGSTSKELVHSFAHHTDTIHHSHGGHDADHDDDGTHLEKQHHHCAFLSFELTPFEHEPFVFVFPFFRERITDQEASAVAHLCDRSVPLRLMRGPPVFA